MGRKNTTLPRGLSRVEHAALVHLETTPIVGIRSTKFKTNTTGVIGVSPVRHKGKLVAYKAVAGTRHSKPLYKFFYISEYPENIAFRLACLARTEFIAKMEEEELTKRNRHIRKLLKKLVAMMR